MASKNFEILNIKLRHLIIFFIFFFIIPKIYNLSFKYPMAFTLTNGKIFVIHSLGIDICDSAYKTSTNILTFSSEISESNLPKISIARFSNDHFIILIINKLYLFNELGEKISETSEISYLNGEYYSLSTHKFIQDSNSKYSYYFLISYVDKNNLYLNLYYYRLIGSSLTKIALGTNIYDHVAFTGLACEFSNYDYYYDYFIICIYPTNEDYDYPYTISLFSINGEIIDFEEYSNYYKIDVKYLKSTTKSINFRPFFCGVSAAGNADCLIFNTYDFYKKDLYTDKLLGKECQLKSYNLKVYYFPQTEEYVFSCLNIDGEIQTTIYNKNMTKLRDIKNPSKRLQKIYSGCDGFYYSIIYSSIYKKYFILSDINCDNHKQFTSLDEEETEESEEEEKEEEKIEEEIEEVSEENNEEEKIEELFKEKYKEESLSENEFFKEEEKIEENKLQLEEEKLEELLEENNEEEKLYENELFFKEEEKIEENKELLEKEKIEETIEEFKEEEIIEEETFEEKEEESVICISEKCKECDENSNKINLCKKCNTEKGYYPLNAEEDLTQNEYYDCYNETTVPKGCYLDNENKVYKLCYFSCQSCNYGGDGYQNNCTSCKNNQILKPDIPNSTNCVTKCEYLYFYQNSNYKCTKIDICPDGYEIEIKEKKKCIDKCENDNEYNIQYDGECYKEAPDGTTYDKIKNIYIDSYINVCKLNEKVIKIPLENLTEYEIDKKARLYAKEFDYTNDHVTVYKNNDYSISIYKNGECISELDLKIDKIDFGNCYNKIKQKLSIEGNLVIVIISKIINGVYYTLDKYMYNPNSTDKININEICANETITAQKDLKEQLKNSEDFKSLEELTNQGIDIFNSQSNFYTDICFHFKSPLDGKDIPVKDRVKLFFPNVTLCDEGCYIKGVNLTTWKALCQCTFNNLVNKNLFGNNIMIQQSIGELKGLLMKSNIEVLTCYKDLMNSDMYKSNIGFFFILSLIVIQIVMIVIYYVRDKNKIKKYLMGITDEYLSYLITKKDEVLIDAISSEIKPEIITSKYGSSNIMKINEELKEEKKLTKNRRKSLRNKRTHKKKLKVSCNSPLNSSAKELKRNSVDKVINKSDKINENNQPGLIMLNMKNEINIDMNEYMKTDPDDMDYDDAIRMDKRKYCQYFFSKLVNEQLILSAFYKNEILKPKSTKILLLILDIDLYLCINGFFFNENYISDMLEIKDDTIYSFINRIVDRIFIITFTGVIINYIIEFFFLEEKKVKKIFRREKENSLVLKYEIIQLIKTIYFRYNLFIIISNVIMIFSLYYVFCFNNVYPSISIEWIKSSLIIIIVMQVIPIFFCFVDASIRFISFRCKSERLFRLSSILF